MNIFLEKRNKKLGAIPFEKKNKNLFFKFEFFKVTFFVIFLFLFLFSINLISKGVPLTTENNIIFSVENLSDSDSDMSLNILKEDLVGLIISELDKKFWNLNLNKIQYKLEADSWVKEAVVRREWPNKLYIHIESHIPVALWNKDFLLTSSAEILPINSFFSVKDLPTLELHSNKNEVDIDSYDDDVIRSAVYWFNYFQRPLKTYGLNISSQIKENDGSFNIVIDNSLVLSLGNKNIKKRYDRFLILLDQYFINRLNIIDSIDLRYMSGVSVRYIKKDRKDEILLSHTSFN